MPIITSTPQCPTPYLSLSLARESVRPPIYTSLSRQTFRRAQAARLYTYIDAASQSFRSAPRRALGHIISLSRPCRRRNRKETTEVAAFLSILHWWKSRSRGQRSIGIFITPTRVRFDIARNHHARVTERMRPIFRDGRNASQWWWLLWRFKGRRGGILCWMAFLLSRGERDICLFLHCLVQALVREGILGMRGFRGEGMRACVWNLLKFRRSRV